MGWWGRHSSQMTGEIEIGIERPARGRQTTGRFHGALAEDRYQSGGPLSAIDEGVPLRRPIEPRHSDDRRPERGIVLHVPGERIALPHERIDSTGHSPSSEVDHYQAAYASRPSTHQRQTSRWSVPGPSRPQKL